MAHDLPRVPGGEVAVRRRYPWWDLGLSFTPRRALALLAFLALGVAVSTGLDWVVSRFVDFQAEDVDRWIGRFGVLGPVAYILLLTATIVIPPLPSVPVDIAGGLAFGVVLGTVYTLMGAMIGGTFNFYVARWTGRGVLERRLGRHAVEQIDAYMDRMGVRLIVATRLIPLFDYDLVSYAAGLTRMPFRSYALATLAGLVLPVVAIVYVGHTLLSHPGRSAAAFAALVVWSATPPVIFLVVTGTRTLARRLRRGEPSVAAEDTP